MKTETKYGIVKQTSEIMGRYKDVKAMGFWDWFTGKTVTEIKRDDYHKLYTELNQIINHFDDRVAEANEKYETYTRSSPYLLQTKIPTSDFTEKRSEINTRLLEKFEVDKKKREDLIIARDRAYGRYEYYRDLAIKEAEEEEDS